MELARLFTSWSSVGLVLVSTVVIYLTVVGYTRVAGPRSLATMSSFDVAATVAIGSTIATVANLGTPLAHGVITLAVLYIAQVGAAILRRRRNIGSALDNDPLLLMAGPELLVDNLRQARVTEVELWSKLRQAGVVRRDDVLAVVLETTGDVSVLQRRGDAQLDPQLLSGVRAAERLRST
ncbi:MAG TPA: YetF domain-containing protein [Acidimicrobiales bacterium]|jgi:uncharacterized membrane protein YcaP (DUF421 family)|nr:YetF domain-containing protein [Acidimicrobiales bacterium]